MEGKYLLDTSSLITPFHENQLRALANGLGLRSWEDARTWLEEWFQKGFAQGKLLLSEEVLSELKKRPEMPGYHLAQKFLSSFKPLYPTSDTLRHLKKVGEFVREHFRPEHAQAFLKVGQADPMLVALAKEKSLTLVTEEAHPLPQADGEGKIMGRVRLPYVAFVFGIRCVPLMTALTETGDLTKAL